MKPLRWHLYNGSQDQGLILDYGIKWDKNMLFYRDSMKNKTKHPPKIFEKKCVIKQMTEMFLTVLNIFERKYNKMYVL